MATATRQITIGLADHGRTMSFDDFIEADFQDGWLYELARGVIDVTEVPDLVHGRAISRIVRLGHSAAALAGAVSRQAAAAATKQRRFKPNAIILSPPQTLIHLNHFDDPVGGLRRAVKIEKRAQGSTQAQRFSL